MNEVIKMVKVEPVAHGCVKLSRRRILLVKTCHGRDEILTEKVVKVEDGQFQSFCHDVLSFVFPLISAKERGNHRYAFIVQAEGLDLFCEPCWEDISITWL